MVARVLKVGRVLKAAKAAPQPVAAPAMKPGFQESAQYEDFVEGFTAQLEGWKASAEPAHEFARRTTGLMRTAYRQWAEKKR